VLILKLKKFTGSIRPDTW